MAIKKNVKKIVKAVKKPLVKKLAVNKPVNKKAPLQKASHKIIIKKTVAKKPIQKLIVKKSVKKTTPHKAASKPVGKKNISPKTLIKPVQKNVVKAPEKVAREIVRPSEEQLKKLLEKGRLRGFITETELLYLFPEVEEYVYEFDVFLGDLQKNGIRIAEDSGRILDVQEKNPNITSAKAAAAVTFDLSKLSADSIQMYLKEIGKVPLLSGDEELELAKRK